MKRFMTSTAIALLLGTSAFAQSNSAVFSDTPFDAAMNLNASDLLGARIYATRTDLTAMASATVDQTTEWDDIGEINEIILTRDGEVQLVIVGVGGFLGIGEKDVAVNMAGLRFISDGQSPDSYFVVVNATEDALNQAPAYERTSMRDETAMGETAVRDTTDQAPMMEREGYRLVMVDQLTADELSGAPVYGFADEEIGNIGALLLDADGMIERAVIDVGGFLGLGERPVAISFKALKILRADEGGALRVYIDSSEEGLEAMPEYDG